MDFQIIHYKCSSWQYDVSCVWPTFISWRSRSQSGFKDKTNIVLSMSSTVLQLGSPNMVCEYILGWWNVAYYLKVYVTLTFDLNHPKQLLFYCLTLLQLGSSICASTPGDSWVLHTIFRSMGRLSARITKYGVWVASWDGGASPSIHRSMWLWPWHLASLTKKASLEHVPYIKLARITKYGVRVTSGDGGVSPTIHRSMWHWRLLFRHDIALNAFVISL